MEIKNLTANYGVELKSNNNSKTNLTANSSNEVAECFTKNSKSADVSLDQAEALKALDEETAKFSNGKDLPLLANSGQYEVDYSTEGGKVIKFARKYSNYKASDNSADLFFSVGKNAGSSSSKLAWCGAFVNYVLKESGADVPSWYENIDNPDYCPNVYNAADDADAIIDRSQAETGTLVLFDQDGNGEKDHIGIVTGVDEDGTIHTIEGNTWNEETGERGVVEEHSYYPGYEEDCGWAPFTFCKMTD